jgi:hypothetical protein
MPSTAISGRYRGLAAGRRSRWLCVTPVSMWTS